MTETELSERLTGLVRSIDGVVQVYDARPAAIAVAADLVATVIGQPVAQPVAITNSAEGISVAVNVAIADSSPAPEVCRRILDAISSHFGAEPGGEKVDRVKIQVSRISYGEDEGAGA